MQEGPRGCTILVSYALPTVYLLHMKKRVLIPILVLCLLLLSLWLYLRQEAPADPINYQAMVSDDQVTVTESKDDIVFTPAGGKTTVALVYYPGGNVAPQSFAYAGRGIAEAGFQVIILKVPFALAIFDIGAAYPYPDRYPEIEHWYLSGFSLGGTAACFALAKQDTRFEALILYASYTDAKHSLRDAGLRVLSISGSNDGLATPQKIEAGKAFLPSDTRFLVIEGANHTQFALYGGGKIQKNDTKAGIEAMAQQKLVIEHTVAFLQESLQ